MSVSLSTDILRSQLTDDKAFTEILWGNENPIIDSAVVNTNQMNDVMDETVSSSYPWAIPMVGLERPSPKIFLMRRQTYSGGGGTDLARWTNYTNLYIRDSRNIYSNFSYCNLTGGVGVLTQGLPLVEPSTVPNAVYYVPITPIDTTRSYNVCSNTDLNVQGEGVYTKYNTTTSSISGADYEEFVRVETPRLYTGTDSRTIYSSYVTPMLYMPFNGYKFYNTESGALSLIDNIEGIYLFDLFGYIDTKQHISYTNQVNRCGVTKNTLYELTLGTEEDVYYDSRFDSFVDSKGYMYTRKSALINLLNYIGIPWTFDLEQAQTEMDPTKFTDGYGTPPKPIPIGQPDNTTNGWDGDGNNKEDSLDLTYPNFSPLQEAVNQYALNSLQLQRVSNYLFTADIFNDWDLLKNDPREGLVSCKYFPFELRSHDSAHIGDQEEIVIGGVQMDNVSSAKILSGYNQILDLGEFDVNEYFGGFLDYQLTSIDVYLPYVGWQQLNASAIMNRKLKIKYVVDLNSGDCACLILSTDGNVDRFENVFTGQMGVDIPILTSNHNENVKQAGSTILSAGVAVGGAIATFASGGTLAPVALAGAGATIASSASSVATMMNHQKLGTPVGSSLSMWMPQDIIFRITRPTKSEASEFKNRRGYRSNYSTQLKNVTGFVQIDDPFLDGLSLHEGEKEQLAQILKGGIFI